MGGMLMLYAFSLKGGLERYLKLIGSLRIEIPCKPCNGCKHND